MDLHLIGHRALVTGGSGAIGRAIATGLLHEGCHVAVLARGAERLKAMAHELALLGTGTVVAVAGDTSDEESVQEAVANVISEFGGVDVLVNCAASSGGTSPVTSTAELTADAFTSAMNDKVLGYARTARHCVPHFLGQGSGRIINIAGQAARTTGSPLTSMRNAAVVALTKTMADELGPHGVGVFVVHPGLTRTGRTSAVFAERARRAGKSAADIEAEASRRSSLGRLVTAAEVADVVTFLASERSIAMHGDVVSVGGGLPGTIHY